MTFNRIATISEYSRTLAVDAKSQDHAISLKIVAPLEQGQHGARVV